MADLNTPRPCRSGRHLFTGSQCSKCQQQRRKEWLAERPGKRAEYARRDYEKNFKGKRKAKADARNLQWAAENREKQKQINRDWRRANRDMCEEQRRRRRARLAGNLADLTEAQWDAILAWHSSPEGTRCAYCFDVCKPTVDHVVPISRGGDHTASNVVPACRPCNTSKHAQEVASWVS